MLSCVDLDGSQKTRDCCSVGHTAVGTTGGVVVGTAVVLAQDCSAKGTEPGPKILVGPVELETS